MKLLIAMGKALLTMFVLSCVLMVLLAACYSLAVMNAQALLVTAGIGALVALFCLLTDSFYEAQKNKP